MLSNCFINVRCENIDVRALLDTGAAVSVITQDLVNSIPNLKNKFKFKSSETLKGVGNIKINVIGDLQCSLNLLSNIFSGYHSFKVIEGTSDIPLILGRDFIRAARIVIDLNNNRIIRDLTSSSCKPDVWPVNIQLLESNFPIFVLDDETLKPGERRLVPLVFDTDVCNGEGCIMPFEFARTKHWRLAGSINKLVGGVLWGELVNISEHTVSVCKFTNVGFWQPCCYMVNNFSVESEPFDLIKELKIDEINLDESQKQALIGVLLDYKDIFSNNDDDLGYCTTIKHTIDVGNSTPVRQRFRRLHPPIKEKVEAELLKLKRQGVIEDSTSPWCSPLVPVRKSDGRLRMCIDYRKLNSLTKLNSYPLPNINDGLSQFSGATYFSTLDLLSGYHQVALDEKSKSLTAFATEGGLYQFRVMPQGACNSPATFQQLMNVVLRGIPSKRALAYLDDVLVVGTSFADHLTNLEEVFGRLRVHNLKLSTRKCDVFKTSVSYLGHILSDKGIMPSKSNVKALLDLPEPKTVRQVKRFNGLCNYYCRFVKDMATIMSPLYKVANKKKLEWTTECREAFNKMKSVLSSYPVLSFPRFGEQDEFIVTTDGSGAGIGGVLSQVQDGEERALGYCSVSFNTAQRKYSATEKELAALRFAIKYFKDYLYGRTFIVRTDHQAILYLDQMKNIDSRLMRTYEDLQIGNYKLEFIRGKDNVVADALSRAPQGCVLPDDCDCSEVTIEKPLKTLEGGPNSLFEALEYACDSTDMTATEMRGEVVKHLLRHMQRYNFNNNSLNRKLVESWKSPHVFADHHLIQPFSDIFSCNVNVQYCPGPLVYYKSNSKSDSIFEVGLQCLGAVHYNVLFGERQLYSDAAEGSVVEDTVLYLLSNDDLSGLEALPKVGTCGDEPTYPNTGTFDEPEGLNNSDSSNLIEAVVLNNCLPLNIGDTIGELPKLTIQVAEIEIQRVHVDMNHPGINQTFRACSNKFKCRKLKQVVREVLRRCDVCQRHKVPVTPKHRLEPQFNLTAATGPGDVLALDLLSFTGKTKRGNVGLLMAIDMKSRYGYAIPIRNKMSRTVAKHLESGILANIVAMPGCILSDNGPEFTGKPFKDMLESYGIEHRTSIPYYPQSNGVVERFNRTIRDRLATALDGNCGDWDLAIYRIVSQYNRSVHRELDSTPASFYSKSEGPFFSKTRVFTRRAGSNFEPFKFNDLVLRRIPFYNKDSRHKLAPKYDGPYKIVKCVSNVSYRIKNLIDGKVVKLVHFSQLKPYYGDSHIQSPGVGQVQGMPVVQWPHGGSLRRESTVAGESGTDIPPVHVPPVRAPRWRDEDSEDEDYFWHWCRNRCAAEAGSSPVVADSSGCTPLGPPILNRQSVSTPDGVDAPPPLQSPVRSSGDELCQPHRYSSILSGDISVEGVLGPPVVLPLPAVDDSDDARLDDEDLLDSASNVTDCIADTPKQGELVDDIVQRIKQIHGLVGQCLELTGSGSEENDFGGFGLPVTEQEDCDRSFRGFDVETCEHHRRALDKVRQILGRTRQRVIDMAPPTVGTSGDTSELRRDLDARRGDLVLLISQLEDSCLSAEASHTLENLDEIKSRLQFFCDCLSLTQDTQSSIHSDLDGGLPSRGEESEWSCSSPIDNWEFTDAPELSAVEEDRGFSSDWVDNYFAAVEEFAPCEENSSSAKCCKTC